MTDYKALSEILVKKSAEEAIRRKRELEKDLTDTVSYFRAEMDKQLLNPHSESLYRKYVERPFVEGNMAATNTFDYGPWAVRFCHKELDGSQVHCCNRLVHSALQNIYGDGFIVSVHNYRSSCERCVTIRISW